jgi:RNA polymerase sigma factor (sigma-70 family)
MSLDPFPADDGTDKGLSPEFSTSPEVEAGNSDIVQPMSVWIIQCARFMQTVVDRKVKTFPLLRKDPEATTDVLQELLRKLLTHGKTHPPVTQETFRKCTRRWAIDVCVDLQNQLRKTSGCASFLLAEAAYTDPRTGQPRGPVDELIERERNSILDKAIRGLSAVIQHAVQLYRGGMKKKDIAAEMHVSPPTVRKYLTKGCATLQARLPKD